MTFEEYSAQAIKTASCNEETILQRISCDYLQPMHAALGMCSEAGEVFEWVDAPSVLPDCELQAELGDCLWYVNLLVHEYAINMERVIQKASSKADSVFNNEEFYDNIRFGAEILSVAAGKVCDFIKASIFYGRIMNLDAMLQTIEDYLSGIILCCRALRITLEEVMDTNISKLRARYGETFSEERANTRDLKKEQVAYSK